MKVTFGCILLVSSKHAPTSKSKRSASTKIKYALKYILVCYHAKKQFKLNKVINQQVMPIGEYKSGNICTAVSRMMHFFMIQMLVLSTNYYSL